MTLALCSGSLAAQERFIESDPDSKPLGPGGLIAMFVYLGMAWMLYGETAPLREWSRNNQFLAIVVWFGVPIALFMLLR